MRFGKEVQEVYVRQVSWGTVVEYLLMVSIFFFGVVVGVVIGYWVAKRKMPNDTPSVSNVLMASRQREIQGIMSGGGIWKWLRNLIGPRR